MNKSQAKRWCFTIFNTDETNLNDLNFKELFKEREYLYLIVGDEICPKTKKRHFQGYVHLKKRTYFQHMKRILPTAHLSIAKGSDEDNKDYCSKEKILIQDGQPQTNGGKNDVGDRIKDIIENCEGNPKRYVLKHENSMMLTTYSQHKNAIWDLLNEKKNMENETQIENEYNNTRWKKWQFKLIQELQKTPDKRKIIWYFDEEGNKGKTYLSKYLMSNGGILLSNGKSADISYIYNGERIAIFDYVRSMESFVNYGILESIKNGYVCSTKYQSCTKTFATPHVVVMANFKPDYNKLSLDRWDVRILTKEDMRDVFTDISNHEVFGRRKRQRVTIIDNSDSENTPEYTTTNPLLKYI